MSLSFEKLEPVCVRDPRTNITGKREYAVLKSGSQSTWKQYSTTAISNSSMQFSVPPPSGGIITDRKVLMTIPVRLTFTGTSTGIGQTLLRSGYDAPRAYGLSSAIETLQTTINNQSVSINLADVIQPLLRFNTDEVLKVKDFSVTPTYMDQTQEYASLVGTNRNPLAGFDDGSDGSVIARGGFPFVVVANPVSIAPAQLLTAVVDIQFTEYIYLSPFYWGCGMSETGFYNVTSMDFNLTFLSQAGNRFWSHSSALGGLPLAGLNGITYAFGSQPNGPTSFASNSPFLLFNYITPQETQVLSHNQVITYPYFDVQRYETGQAVVAPGVTVQMVSNNIQLNSIPRRMYIFVRQRNQELYASAENTDTFFSIENISIQFQNKNGLLASASKQQLYEISVKNHCSMSWNEWSGGPVYPSAGNFTNPFGTVGSVLCLEFATDIGLDSLDAPGKLAQSMLQVQLLAKNIAANPITPSVYIITVLEGTFTIEGLGRSSTNIGVISSQDILDCQQQASINYNSVQEVNGGNFMSGLRSFGKWLTGNHVISDTLGKTPLGFLAPALRAITGLGDGSMMYHQGGVKAGRRGGVPAGVLLGGEDGGDEGGAEGGARLTRKQLAKRIMY
jgi:hypothetical protein